MGYPPSTRLRRGRDELHNIRFRPCRHDHRLSHGTGAAVAGWPRGAMEAAPEDAAQAGGVEGAGMSKWAERAALAVMAIILAIVCIGMYSTWRDCNAKGGTTVRGLFGLE